MHSTILIVGLLLASPPGAPAGEDRLQFPGETHMQNVRQLTFGGQNAEAYFSPDGRSLIFQTTSGDLACDQIFTMGVDGSNRRMVSTGKGRTTCAYFLDGARTVIYASTHGADPECPPPPDRALGYVWPLHAGYDIYLTRLDPASTTPSGPVRLTDAPGYDAEATVSPDGSRIVFTSMRDGDLELYTMDPDGSDVKRLTWRIGYDGGAFFSPDGSRIAYRAFHPRSMEELVEYRRLLRRNLFRPSWLEIFVMNRDGTDSRRLTDFKAASFCPAWFPDAGRIIFSSNLPGGRVFSLYTIDLDGNDLQQVSFGGEFEGFPLFSPDGTKLVFASNRNGRAPRETNIFIADWVP